MSASTDATILWKTASDTFEFSHAVTWPSGSSTNANTAYTYSQVGHLPLAGGTLTGNLEIATSAADTGVDLILDGNRTSNGGIGSIVFNNNGDSVGMIRSNRASANDAADMLFYTQATGGANAERMRITSAGNVGIGTSSPAAKLHIEDSGSNAAKLRIGFDSSRYYDIYRENLSGTGLLYFYGSQAGFNGFVFDTADGERARIDSSGRLLIGTSSLTSGGDAVAENATFIVSGRVGSATDSGRINLQRGSSATGSQQIGVINFTDSSNNAYARLEATADGVTGTGDYPGRLVFSTTADGASSPTERMRISQNGLHLHFAETTAAVFSTAQPSTGTSAVFAVRHSATSTTTGIDSLYIFPDGDVQNSNNSYGAISDIKLKENIVDANSQWSDIKALQVRNYNFKEGQTHTQIGVIAQEAELVSPGLVSESPDLDEDGNDLGTVTKSVNYSVLYMKAVKALQEAMERIETLEAEVAALKAQ